MTVWVLLLRGVGGPVQVPHPLLKAVLRAAGFDGVRVLGHTGNAVARGPWEEPGEVVRRAGDALIREAGFDKGLQAASAAEWAAILAGNPFPGAEAAPTTLHVALMGAEPDPARVAALAALSDGRDGLAVRGRVAYLHTPDGFSRSPIAARFDRGIGVPVTARNWRTAERLLAACGEAA